MKSHSYCQFLTTAYAWLNDANDALTRDPHDTELRLMLATMSAEVASEEGKLVAAGVTSGARQ